MQLLKYIQKPDEMENDLTFDINFYLDPMKHDDDQFTKYCTFAEYN